MESLVYILLVATSVVGLTFIVERGLALRWKKVIPPEIEAAVEAVDYEIEQMGPRVLASAREDAVWRSATAGPSESSAVEGRPRLPVGRAEALRLAVWRRVQTGK